MIKSPLLLTVLAALVLLLAAASSSSSLVSAVAEQETQFGAPQKSRRSLTESEVELFSDEFAAAFNAALRAVKTRNPRRGETRASDEQYLHEMPTLCETLGLQAERALRLARDMLREDEDGALLAIGERAEQKDAERLTSLANVLHASGVVFAAKCRHDFGRELLTEAMLVRRKTLGDADQQTADTTVALALATIAAPGSVGHEMAEHLLQQALTAYRLILVALTDKKKKKHNQQSSSSSSSAVEDDGERFHATFNVIDTLSHLGAYLCQFGRPHDGTALLDEAVQMLDKIRILGGEDKKKEDTSASSAPATVSPQLLYLRSKSIGVFTRAALGFQSSRKYDRAVELQERAVKLHRENSELGSRDESSLATQQREFADALSELAGLYAAIGKNEKTVECLREAVSIRRAILNRAYSTPGGGAEGTAVNKEFADLLHSFGITLEALGHTEEGLQSQAEAAEIWKRILAPPPRPPMEGSTPPAPVEDL